MRPIFLVLFCTVALQWDGVSCRSDTLLVSVGNVWSSERPAEVTLDRNGDEVSWTEPLKLPLNRTTTLLSFSIRMCSQLHHK